jgi:hypothetical protein
MMFTFNSCRFVICVLSLALSAYADTIRGALTIQQSEHRMLPQNDIEISSNLGSNTVDYPLVPGAYTALGIVGLTGELKLSASSSTCSITTATAPCWTFTFPAAFTTAADSEMVFVDGSNTYYRASDDNPAQYIAWAAKVTWKAKGAITLGASSLMGGSMESQQTITLGASAESGLLQAKAAISLGASAKSGPLISGAAITVGASGTCGPILSGAAVTVGAGASIESLRSGGGAAIAVGAAVVCAQDPTLTWVSQAGGCPCVDTTITAENCGLSNKYD